MNNRQKLMLVLAFVGFALLQLRFFQLYQDAKKREAASLGTVADFRFTDQTGKPYGSNELKGKLWVADFFFTQCMGPCPLLTTKMAQLQSEFSKAPLHFVSFSVDPEHDTPEAMLKYANSYGANPDRWRFLTAPRKETYDLVRKSFHLAVETSPDNDGIMHSLMFVLVNQRGSIIGYYDTSDEEAMRRLRKDIKDRL